jgi:hypothetical protein
MRSIVWLEFLAGDRVDSLLAGVLLPTPNGCVDIERVDFDAIASSPGALSSN